MNTEITDNSTINNNI